MTLSLLPTSTPLRRGGGGGRHCLAVLCVLTIAPLLFIVTVSPSTAGASSAVTVNGTINAQPLATSSQSNPVRLYPLRPADIVLTVHNHSSRPVRVATVRLSGEVMGLTFFAFDNSVAFTVPAFHSVTNRYSIPLVGLNGQATGLVDGSLSVLDPGQQVLASQDLVVDVRGSLSSVYGIFGLAVAVLTVFAFALVLLELARQRLPANRFLRGLYFLVPGLGLGLVLIFTLSATRVFVPSLGHWLPLIIVTGIVFFVVGFLTPDPRMEEEDDLDDSFAASPTVVMPTRTVGAPGMAAPMNAPAQRSADGDGSHPGSPATAEMPAVAGASVDTAPPRSSEPTIAAPARAPSNVTSTDDRPTVQGPAGANSSAGDTPA
jgi:hypothetical protein